MIEETLEEFIKLDYSFMDCSEGCWNSGGIITAISKMDKGHIQNCIRMAENWNIDLTDNQYKDEIERRHKKKIFELREAL